jgi:hypothetical protein
VNKFTLIKRLLFGEFTILRFRPALYFTIFSIGLAITNSVRAETEGVLFAPAEYIRQLFLPGTMNHFLRPARILIDRNHHEIYVADAGHSRIVIFDDAGIYKYEFSVADYCGAPRDLVVNSDGEIFVLGSTRNGKRIMMFDYDGLFMGEFAPGAISENVDIRIKAIAIDDGNCLYVLDGSVPRITVYKRSGDVKFEFSILDELDDEMKREMVFTSLTINDDIIYLPVPMLGSVYRYNLDGQSLGSIGIKGTTPGALNFPVSVDVTDENIILVLDKHRFNVVCFAENGKFLGEFGGKGVSPGWFYHPTWVAVDGRDQIYIGQVFQNKVQVCSLPEFIKERNRRLSEDDQTKLKGDNQLGSIENNNGKRR